jgi:predicted glycosyltransferase
MSRYLFSSHDGYGLGHVRRNVLIARELLRVDPAAEITLVTGVPRRPIWLQDPGFRVVAVPALLKNARGVYENPGLGFHAAVAERARIFSRTVAEVRPDVVVVDRHPYGTAGELREGLWDARRHGATVVLGLRDVIDEVGKVRRELDGAGWSGVRRLFDEILVFGSPVLCDHEREYALPMRPTYCGWVVEPAAQTVRTENLVAISAGGGGDGKTAFRLGVQALRRLPHLRGIVAAGPYSQDWAHQAMGADSDLAARVELSRDTGSTVQLFAAAGAVVQMAGYNSSVEALSAGVRAVLIPRRSPRREQAIRASRLASLGLADVVDETASPDEVAWLLNQPRLLPDGACERAGISLDGATFAAEMLTSRALVAVA